MWGGVKGRRQFGDVFKNWSASRGVEELRTAMFKEPRPWNTMFLAHQSNHLLQDHHSARLLSWGTTVMQLETDPATKLAAYRYTQEVMNTLASAHKVGRETLSAYMRLCAEGRDLTSGFRWYEFWLESRKDGADTLSSYTWLLRVAGAAPSDEACADMMIAVRDKYLARFCAPLAKDDTGERALLHFEPSNDDEAKDLHDFFCAFKALEPRAQDEENELRPFLDSIPVSIADAAAHVQMAGWPGPGKHHWVFPTLEGGVTAPEPTVARPVLRDSLLHPSLVERLEDAALVRRDPQMVIALLEEYKEKVKEERERRGPPPGKKSTQTGSQSQVWRQPVDASAILFRKSVVADGGLTAELYHYVICALAPTRPTAALRTLARLAEANLRVLDVTRAVALVAAAGAYDEQLRLFQEQLEAARFRVRLDEDHGTNKAVEHYWKYEYTDFLYYRNALDDEAFFLFLMDGLGVPAVQKLLQDSEAAQENFIREDDLVAVNDPLRRAAVRHLRRQVGQTAVQAALDTVANHAPRLDICVVNAAPHFTDFFMGEDSGDSVRTDAAALRELLAPYTSVVVLDTSFVETSEAFLSLCAANSEDAGARKLVLVPYFVLSQLAVSVEPRFVSFDTALAEALKTEPFLASQRLRALAALCVEKGKLLGTATTTSTTSVTTGGITVRPLYLSECLLAQAVTDKGQLKKLGLRPDTSDNDLMVLILSMLSSLAPKGTTITLCADDAALLTSVRKLATELFPSSGGLTILSSEPTQDIDAETGLLNDNPTLDLDVDNFSPKLTVSLASVRRDAESAPPDSEQSAAAAASAAGVCTPTLSAVDLFDALSDNATPTVQTDASTSNVPSAEDAGATVPLSPWMMALADEEEAITGSSSTPAETLEVPTSATTAPQEAAPSSEEMQRLQQEQEASEALLMSLYRTPHDVVPVGAQMKAAAEELGDVFQQFDTVNPLDAEMHAQNAYAQSSGVQHAGAAGGGVRKRRRSLLEREYLQNRGVSVRERRKMARQMSNMAGGRVPFNLRYRVVEANVNDPKNARFVQSYREGLRRKRDGYQRHHERHRED